jgi:hypothetical protein
MAGHARHIGFVCAGQFITWGQLDAAVDAELAKEHPRWSGVADMLHIPRSFTSRATDTWRRYAKHHNIKKEALPIKSRPRMQHPQSEPSPRNDAALEFEGSVRAEIDLLAAAIMGVEPAEAQRGAARRLRKRFHPDSVRDVTSLLPDWAPAYQRLSQHANAVTERFLEQ